MQRSVLFSLMVIGAVVALISGATFSAFTDSASVVGTINAGTVHVDAASGEDDTFTWTGTGCPSPLGSGKSCTSTVAVSYEGTLAATMDISLASEEDSDSEGTCFSVSATWTPAGGSGTPLSGSPLSLDDLTAADGSLAVTVTLGTAQACQGATIDLTLTVTTTEVV